MSILNLNENERSQIEDLKKQLKMQVDRKYSLPLTFCNFVWNTIQDFCLNLTLDENQQNIYFLAFGILHISDSLIAINKNIFSEIIPPQKISTFMKNLYFQQIGPDHEEYQQFESYAELFHLQKREFILYISDKTSLRGFYYDISKIYPTPGSLMTSSSLIYLCLSDPDLHLVAVKRFSKDSMLQSYVKQCIERQNDLQSTNIFHPSLLQHLDHGWQGDYYCFVTPFCSFGTIKDQIDRRAPTFAIFSQDELLIYSYQLITALMLMHRNNFIHRDIKPSNLFLRTPYWLVIGDYGLVKKADNNVQSTNVGTFMYVSPETIRIESDPSIVVSFPTDIYSFAMTLYHMKTLEVPFPNKTYPEVVEALKEGARPERITRDDDPINNLIIDCWDDNPDYRPSAEDIISRLEEIWDNYHDDGSSLETVVQSIYNQPSDEWQLFSEAKDISQQNRSYWDDAKQFILSNDLSHSDQIEHIYEVIGDDEDPLF